MIDGKFDVIINDGKTKADVYFSDTVGWLEYCNVSGEVPDDDVTIVAVDIAYV